MLALIDGQDIYPGHEVYKEIEEEIDIIYIDGKTLRDKDLKESLKDVKYILNGGRRLDRDMLKSLPKLEYIGMLATGYNSVDLDAAKEAGLVVTNVPDYSTAAVSQFAVAMILNALTSIDFYNKESSKGSWTKGPDFYKDHPIIEANGKTLGVLGFGNIGRKVAGAMEALGMDIIFYDKKETGDKRQRGLEEVLKTSDVLTLHLPLNDETHHILNKDTFDLMKEGVIIVNTARGGLIKEEDLIEALNSGRVYKASLDVLEKEPFDPDNPLLTMDRVRVSPHVSWASKEARSSLLEIAYENLKAYLSGNIQNRVG